MLVENTLDKSGRKRQGIHEMMDKQKSKKSCIGTCISFSLSLSLSPQDVVNSRKKIPPPKVSHDSFDRE
jgi:hypothetical protein